MSLEAGPPSAAALGAALLLGVATLLLVPPSAPGAQGLLPVAGPARRRVPSVPGVVVVAAVALVLVPGGGTTSALVLIGLGVALFGSLLHRRRSRATAAERAGLRATEFCEAVAAELGAGAPPQHALASAAEDFPEYAPVAATGRLGGDVPSALRALATTPGLDDLRLVAGAWQVSYRSGAGLADSLDRVGATLRARRRTARLVAAELASARATARIMAALPVVFVLAGSGLGADPVGFLTAGPAGVACLAGGLALTGSGLLWLQRIAESVVR